MPVFKIKKDGAWQEVAGVSGHSHSVSQIVDFPSLEGFATENYVNEKIGDIHAELPVVTTTDSGKFLRVSSDGKWVAQALQNAEEVAF